ncbi:MAG: PEP-CTERM sorting domain-containing protein [Opitutales bacterium]|nr:PEP-CTERM sorting domain-containing protein [Opitutales bacterium]
MNKTLRTSLFALVAASVQSAEIWRAPTATVEEGDWNDSLTWVNGSIPGSSDTAKIDKSGSYTNSDTDLSIARLDLYSGTVNVSSGTFAANVTYVYGGEFNIFGSAKVTTASAFNSGDGIDGGTTPSYVHDTEARINVYGNATVEDNTWGILIGESALNQNVVANFYGNSTITAKNGGNGVKIGTSRTYSTESSATSVLNVYENSTVNATTLYFYRNATLNVYGEANFTASAKAYIGDSKTDSVANMNLGGSSRTTLSSYSFVFNYANLTVKDNATLTLNQNMRIGSDEAEVVTPGHLIFKDSAKLIQANGGLIMYGADSTIELHGSNITVADGQTWMTKCIGLTSEAEKGITGGTLKFVADSEGISTLVAGWVEYNDPTAQTAYAIELDFTNFNPAAGEGVYTFNIITSINNWNGREATIMQNYLLSTDDPTSNLVKVIKAGADDTYEFFVNNGNKTFGINYNFAAVPEPSTYAAIFGALALAFAAYRRRK